MTVPSASFTASSPSTFRKSSKKCAFSRSIRTFSPKRTALSNTDCVVQYWPVLWQDIPEGAFPGKSVDEDPEQSAIPEACVRGRVYRAKKLLNLVFDGFLCFPFGPRKSVGLDFPGRIHGQHSFFGEPGEQHPDRGHVLFDRGRRGLDLCLGAIQ